MAQILSNELLEYIRCCNNSGELPPGVILKYVFSRVGLDTSTAEDVIQGYNAGHVDATTIDTAFGVGTPGIISVEITYVHDLTYLQETINIDGTSPSTFWEDINNWLLLNDFNSIIYDAGLDRWLINDIYGETYIHII